MLLTQLIRRQYLYFCTRKASKLSKLSTPLRAAPQEPRVQPLAALLRPLFQGVHSIYIYIYIFIYIYIACERLHHTSEVVIFKARRHKFVLITGFFFPPRRWQEIEQLVQAVAQICTMGGAPGKTGEVSDAT